MQFLSQLAAVTGLTVRTLPRRAGSSAIAVVGVAGVVIVLVAVLSIAEGFRAAMAEAGSADTAIVMRGGSDSELSSLLLLTDARVVKDGPGVRRAGDRAVGSAELFVIVDVAKRTTGTAANVPLRGVEPEAFAVRDHLRVVEGRPFEFGTGEVIVGRAASGQFDGIELGDTPRWGNADWRVVGIFETGGTAAESEIWGDMRVVQSVYGRGDDVSAVYAKLESAAAFDGFRDALERDPRLNVVVERESDYYAAQSQALRAIITTIGTGIAALMAVGAVFGAINTMYAAVANRTREIATLRALGFRNTPVILSVVSESILVCAAGGLVGGAAAYWGFNGYQTATLNWQTFSQVAFAFRVTPELLAHGVAWSVAMGVAGGILPALRAARLPISAALKER